jgi:Cu2+-exporting ATPase
MYLTIIALTVGTLTFTFWIFFGKQLVFVLERAVTVMVITCPYALGLAIPLVVAVSTSIAAKSGLVIRDRQYLSELEIFRLSFLTKQVHSLKEGSES